MSILQAVRFSSTDVRSVKFTVKKSGKTRVTGKQLPPLTIRPVDKGFECRVGPRKSLLTAHGKTAEAAYRAAVTSFWM